MKIIMRLGGACKCGATDNLQIHHIDRWMGKLIRRKGRMERLADWKRNITRLKVMCSLCHREEHKLCQSCVSNA
jgi:hypothetical protein